MKKVLISMLAVALMATAADATLIGLRWKDAPAQQSLDVATGAPAVVQVYITTMAGDLKLQGIGGRLQAWDNAAANTATTSIVNETAVAAPLPGWVVSAPPVTTLGPLNAALTQFGTFQPIDGAGVGNVAGTYILAEITLTHTEVATKNIYLTLDRNTVSLFSDGGNQPYSDLTTQGKWDRTKANVNSGYIAYGNWGNPGWGGAAKGQQTPNGLILHTPEPASLALLVLGGIAALRRR